MLLFPANVLVPVFDTYDEMAVIGGVCHRQTRILCLSAIHRHAIIHDQLTPGLQLGDQIIPVQEESKPIPILRMDQPIHISLGGFKEIISFGLNTQLAGFLFRGEFRVT